MNISNNVMQINFHDLQEDVCGDIVDELFSYDDKRMDPSMLQNIEKILETVIANGLLPYKIVIVGAREYSVVFQQAVTNFAEVDLLNIYAENFKNMVSPLLKGFTNTNAYELVRELSANHNYVYWTLKCSWRM